MIVVLCSGTEKLGLYSGSPGSYVGLLMGGLADLLIPNLSKYFPKNNIELKKGKKK